MQIHFLENNSREALEVHQIISQPDYSDGLVQDCSNSGALAIELLQSCTNPSTWRSRIELILSRIYDRV